MSSSYCQLHQSGTCWSHDTSQMLLQSFLQGHFSGATTSEALFHVLFHVSSKLVDMDQTEAKVVNYGYTHFSWKTASFTLAQGRTAPKAPGIQNGCSKTQRSDSTFISGCPQTHLSVSQFSVPPYRVAAPRVLQSIYSTYRTLWTAALRFVGLLIPLVIYFYWNLVRPDRW